MRRWPRPPGPSPWRSGCTKAPGAQGLHLRARSSLRTFTRRPPSNRTTGNRKARAFLRWAAHVREDSHRQPGRDCLPDHQDGEAHGDQDRGGLFGSRRGRAACRNGGRGDRHRPAAGGTVLSPDRQDRRRLQEDRRRRRPSGLRIPVRARRFRACARRRRHRLHRTQPARHRGDGRQDRIRRNSPMLPVSRPFRASSA